MDLGVKNLDSRRNCQLCSDFWLQFENPNNYRFGDIHEALARIQAEARSEGQLEFRGLLVEALSLLGERMADEGPSPSKTRYIELCREVGVEP